MKAPGEAGALMLPVDGCGNCLTRDDSKITHPYEVEVGPSVLAWYRCGECGHAWRTAWHLSVLELGCPGCRYCPAPALGGAA